MSESEKLPPQPEKKEDEPRETTTGDGGDLFGMGVGEEEGKKEGEEDEPPIPAWIRCCRADIYFRRDKEVMINH